MGRAKQVAALGAFARAQKEENRRKLLEAATRVFDQRGYLAPSVDDIAQEAGVSRQTFYRHFDGKLGIAMEYYNVQRQVGAPIWKSLDATGARDHATVESWLNRLLDYHFANKNRLRALSEMGMVEPVFVDQAKKLVPELVLTLGERIPAFAFAPGISPDERRRWADACLLLNLILVNCNNQAQGFDVLNRESLVPALTRAFLQYVANYSG